MSAQMLLQAPYTQYVCCHGLTASQFCSPKLLHKLHLLCTGGKGVGPSHLPQGVLGRDGQVKTGCLVLTDHGLVLGRQDFQCLQVVLEQLNVQILPGNGNIHYIMNWQIMP